MIETLQPVLATYENVKAVAEVSRDYTGKATTPPIQASCLSTHHQIVFIHSYVCVYINIYVYLYLFIYLIYLPLFLFFFLSLHRPMGGRPYSQAGCSGCEERHERNGLWIRILFALNVVGSLCAGYTPNIRRQVSSPTF